MRDWQVLLTKYQIGIRRRWAVLTKCYHRCLAVDSQWCVSRGVGADMKGVRMELYLCGRSPESHVHVWQGKDCGNLQPSIPSSLSLFSSILSQRLLDPHPPIILINSLPPHPYPPGRTPTLGINQQQHESHRLYRYPTSSSPTPLMSPPTLVNPRCWNTHSTPFFKTTTASPPASRARAAPITRLYRVRTSSTGSSLPSARRLLHYGIQVSR
jgi:hypothetical protein